MAPVGPSRPRLGGAPGRRADLEAADELPEDVPLRHGGAHGRAAGQPGRDVRGGPGLPGHRLPVRHDELRPGRPRHVGRLRRRHRAKIVSGNAKRLLGFRILSRAAGEGDRRRRWRGRPGTRRVGPPPPPCFAWSPSPVASDGVPAHPHHDQEQPLIDACRSWPSAPMRISSWWTMPRAERPPGRHVRGAGNRAAPSRSSRPADRGGARRAPAPQAWRSACACRRRDAGRAR